MIVLSSIPYVCLCKLEVGFKEICDLATHLFDVFNLCGFNW